MGKIEEIKVLVRECIELIDSGREIWRILLIVTVISIILTSIAYFIVMNNCPY